MYHKLVIISLFCIIIDTLSAQRVFLNENVSKFNATVFEETDPEAKVSWEVYMTDNLNPTIEGNWKQMMTPDSAVFVFKRLNNRQAAAFTYRVVEDSMSTRFVYSGSRIDFLEPISYMIINDISTADVIMCLTPNKWMADNVIYRSEELFNTNKAHWRFVDEEEMGTIKIYITTNRELATKLIYFTDNPLEAQIR